MSEREGEGKGEKKERKRGEKDQRGKELMMN